MTHDLGDRDKGPDADPDAFVVRYRNLIAVRNSDTLHEKMHAQIDARLADMRARWKAWWGDDDLHETALARMSEKPKMPMPLFGPYVPDSLAPFVLLTLIGIIIGTLIAWIKGERIFPFFP